MNLNSPISIKTVVILVPHPDHRDSVPSLHQATCQGLDENSRATSHCGRIFVSNVADVHIVISAKMSVKFGDTPKKLPFLGSV